MYLTIFFFNLMSNITFVNANNPWLSDESKSDAQGHKS